MNYETLKKIIDNAFDDILNVNPDTKGELKKLFEEKKLIWLSRVILNY